MSFKINKRSWKRVTLGEVADASKEKCDPSTGEVERYVAGEHMDTDDLTIHRWGEVGDGYLGPAFHRRFRSGQVLYGSRRTYLRKVAVADFDGVCANTTFVIQPKDERVISPGFLPFILTAEPFHSFAISESKGSVNPYVNWSDIARYGFELPPLQEQIRIAELLWAVEAERKSHVNVVHSVHKSEAAWVSTLTRKTNSIALLGDVVDTILDRRGITPKKLGGDFVESGVPVLSAMNIVDGDIDFARQERYVSDAVAERWMTGPLKPGDILMTSEAPLGSTVLIRREMRACLGQRLFALRPKNSMLMPEYLYSWINSEAGQSALEARASGTTVRGIRQAELVKIEVPIPDFDTQRDFLTGWQKIQEAKQAAELAILSCQVLFRSLLRETFEDRT